MQSEVSSYLYVLLTISIIVLLFITHHKELLNDDIIDQQFNQNENGKKYVKIWDTKSCPANINDKTIINLMISIKDNIDLYSSQDKLKIKEDLLHILSNSELSTYKDEYELLIIDEICKPLSYNSSRLDNDDYNNEIDYESENDRRQLDKLSLDEITVLEYGKKTLEEVDIDNQLNCQISLLIRVILKALNEKKINFPRINVGKFLLYRRTPRSQQRSDTIFGPVHIINGKTIKSQYGSHIDMDDNYTRNGKYAIRSEELYETDEDKFERRNFY